MGNKPDSLASYRDAERAAGDKENVKYEWSSNNQCVEDHSSQNQYWFELTISLWLRVPIAHQV